MNRCVVLDAEALTALAGRPGRRNLEVRAALRAAVRLRREVIVPSVILAELYRGPRHNPLVDELGGGLVLTVDVEDLNQLAASYGNVTVISLP